MCCFYSPRSFWHFPWKKWPPNSDVPRTATTMDTVMRGSACVTRDMLEMHALRQLGALATARSREPATRTCVAAIRVTWARTAVPQCVRTSALVTVCVERMAFANAKPFTKARIARFWHAPQTATSRESARMECASATRASRGLTALLRTASLAVPTELATPSDLASACVMPDGRVTTASLSGVTTVPMVAASTARAAARTDGRARGATFACVPTRVLVTDHASRGSARAMLVIWARTVVPTLVRVLAPTTESVTPRPMSATASVDSPAVIAHSCCARMIAIETASAMARLAPAPALTTGGARTAVATHARMTALTTASARSRPDCASAIIGGIALTAAPAFV